MSHEQRLTEARVAMAELTDYAGSDMSVENLVTHLDLGRWASIIRALIEPRSDDEREALGVWDDARIRDAFLDDGGQAEYYDPINGAREHRRVAGAIFDAWLAAHDAELLRRQGPVTDAAPGGVCSQCGDPFDEHSCRPIPSCIHLPEGPLTDAPVVWGPVEFVYGATARRGVSTGASSAVGPVTDRATQILREAVAANTGTYMSIEAAEGILEAVWEGSRANRD